MTDDIAALQSWIGRQETVTDMLAPQPAAALTATLDRDDAPAAGAPLPPLWHYLYFLPFHRQSEIASDGHAKRGGFIPPIKLPRRMFAGARLTFEGDVRIGETARRTSTITGLDVKQGRTGELIFLRLRQEIEGAHGKIVEEQDIVYRDHPRTDEPPPTLRRATMQASWRHEFRADIMLLFRYSALIFNAHRIHYDRNYVTITEGYPGLVVHGQLVATLLADLVKRHSARRLTSFRFRSLRPLFDTAPFTLCGAPSDDRVTLWAEDADGAMAMEAEAEFLVLTM
jgi:3-methylfumaryl-CoA hydratase